MALPLFILIAVLLGSTLGIYAIIMSEQKKRGKKRPKQKNLKQNTQAYKFLSENFLTRKSFRKVVEQVAGLSIYNFLEVRIQAVKYYSQALAMSIGLLFVGIILFQDIIAVLLVGVFALVLHTTLITKRLDEVHFIVLKQLSVALSSVREHYTRLGNIPDALNECSKGPYIQKSLDKIYLILTSNDAEDKLEEFYRTVPFQMLQTFAGVCYLLNDVGDENSPDGTSAFKTSISLLKKEADLEIRKLTRQKILFNSLEYLPLAPLPFIGFFKWFFMTNIPGTSSIYNGMIGYISQTLIILSGMLGYYLITTINSSAAVRHDDRSEIILSLMYKKHFKKLLRSVVPKKAKVRDKHTTLLRGSLSQKDIPYIYASKIISSAVAFVVTLFLLTAFTYIGKEYIYQNIAPVSLLGSSEMTVLEQEQLRAIDAEFLENESKPRDRDTMAMLKATFPKMSQMDLQDQLDRLNAKYDSYHNAKFRWWYILIAYVIAIGGWFIPEIMIKVRQKLVRAEAEEDVLQMQTMLSILMYTNLDTLEVLWWLGRQSRIHKDALVYAYHEYPSDPEKALSRLKDKSVLPEFQQLIERLMSTIYQISLAEAFDDLISDREHMLGVREMVQEATLYKRRSIASPFARAPIIIAALGHVLAPIGILGVTEMLKVFGQLTG